MNPYKIGIGLAVAQLCQSLGARVLIGDLKLTSEAEKLIQSSKDTVAFTHCDVTSWSDLRNLISHSVQKFGDVPDVYVPSAGIFEPPWSNFYDDTEDGQGYYKTIRINVEHPIKLTRIAMKALLGANKKGVVCLIASRAGLRGIYLSSLYCASKHAIVGFAKSMAAADGEEGVKIVCICPGAVMSPLWTDRQDDKMQAFHVDDEDIQSLSTAEVAETMLRMVQEGKYRGGAVVSKVVGDESVVFEGALPVTDAKGRTYGEIHHVQAVFAKERGKKWQG